MKPPSFVALVRPFMDCVETLEEASLASIKRIASYSQSFVPYCLTYCQGVSCLQTICVGSVIASPIQDSITDERTTAALLRQLLAPVYDVMRLVESATEMMNGSTHTMDNAMQATQTASEEESSGSGSVEEKDPEDVASDDSVDEFMKTMADDIFMDREELERRNSAPCLRRIEKSRRRQQNKKTQPVKKPTWRAQNFRSKSLRREVMCRSGSADEGGVCVAAAGESHQHQQKRTNEMAGSPLVHHRSRHLQHRCELRQSTLLLQGNPAGAGVLPEHRTQVHRLHASQVHRRNQEDPSRLL